MPFRLMKPSEYAERRVPLTALFPRLSVAALRDMGAHRRDPCPCLSQNDQQVLLTTMHAMYRGGYDDMLARFGFHDERFPTFSGHCHQMTPALGAALVARGFTVHYLEAARVDPSAGFALVDPSCEPNHRTRAEFVRIGRIPYCCLEVVLDGVTRWISPKHAGWDGGAFVPGLSPECYLDYDGHGPLHPDTSFDDGGPVKKSALYLAPYWGLVHPFTWMKRSRESPEPPEVFQVFDRMQLEMSA